jgi:hypothetical protein
MVLSGGRYAGKMGREFAICQTGCLRLPRRGRSFLSSTVCIVARAVVLTSCHVGPKFLTLCAERLGDLSICTAFSRIRRNPEGFSRVLGSKPGELLIIIKILI